jgi:hypothetical protein
MTRTGENGIAVRVAGFVLGVLVGCLPWSVASAESLTQEDKIKAAILYKLGKFVEWPESAFVAADSPLAICLTGPDPIQQVLEQAPDRAVQGRPITIRTLGDQAVENSGCHILYFPSTKGPSPGELSGAPVLTVSDTDGFAARGGMVGLVRRGRRIKFQINPSAAQRAGLRLSAPLLDVAEIVE